MLWVGGGSCLLLQEFIPSYCVFDSVFVFSYIFVFVGCLSSFVSCYLGGSATESGMLPETRRAKYVAGRSCLFSGRSEIQRRVS